MVMGIYFDFKMSDTYRYVFFYVHTSIVSIISPPLQLNLKTIFNSCYVRYYYKVAEIGAALNFFILHTISIRVLVSQLSGTYNNPFV